MRGLVHEECVAFQDIVVAVRLEGGTDYVPWGQYTGYLETVY